jgi:hypothetical protein
MNAQGCVRSIEDDQAQGLAGALFIGFRRQEQIPLPGRPFGCFARDDENKCRKSEAGPHQSTFTAGTCAAKHFLDPFKLA